jgi:phosphohistidine phosphatase
MLKSLWVMRHGLAESQFSDDFSRQLSPVGREQALDVSRQIKADTHSLPTHMIASPFARTQATAKVVHAALEIVPPFETDDMLVHFADHKTLGDFLLACEYESLIIVSHMPIVGYLCQYLAPGCEIFGFQTAQVVRLGIEHSGSSAPLVHVEKTYLPK